jgi:hypothetical protein
MTFEPGGSALLVASHTGEGLLRLSLWDTSTGNRLTPPMELPGTAQQIRGAVRHLARSPDGTKVAIAGQTGFVWEYPLPSLWDAGATESTDRIVSMRASSLR